MSKVKHYVAIGSFHNITQVPNARAGSALLARLLRRYRHDFLVLLSSLAVASVEARALAES